MKKYVTGLAAVILAISASAFTKATEVKDGEFYFDVETETILPITTAGECLEGVNFCTYHLLPDQPNDGNPIHYEGEGSSMRQWVKSEQ
jgi:hypothetical protein